MVTTFFEVVGYVLLAAIALSAVVLAAAAVAYMRTPCPSFSSRGEEAGVPEDHDDLMAVALAVAVTPDCETWRLFEEQCDSLQPLADRVARVGEWSR